MSDRKVTIGVESSADLQAINDAQVAVKNLANEEQFSGDKTKDAGDKKKKAGEETQKYGQAAGRAAELTASLSGAMGQGGPASAQMGAGLRVLKALMEGTSAGLTGMATILLGAGVSAWVSYNNKVEESKKKIAEFKLQMQDNAREIQMSRMSDLADQHDKLRAAIDSEADAYNRLSSARAAVDNAEKGSRLADITLKEKQARFALKPGDEVGAARVSAEFAGQRRDLETEYAIKEARRTAEQKNHELAAAQEKLATSQKQEAELAKQLEATKAQVLALSQEKVDLFGAKAPMREQVETRMGPGGIPITTSRQMVVDEEARKRRAAQIDNQLQGSKDTPGLTEDFGKLSDALAAIVVQKAKEKIEAEARQLEADAANKNLSTVNTMNPRIDAADSALEGKSLAQVTAQANLAKFGGDIESARRSAENVLDAKQSVADSIDASGFKKFGLNSPTYRDALKVDKEADKQAAKAKQLADATKALEEQVKAMDPEVLTKSLVSLTAKLANLNKAVEDLKKQQARP